MSEITFYKLTLELNPKLNKEKTNLLERLQAVIDAKSGFNLGSGGSKHLVILNLTQQSINLMLRLENHLHSKSVGIRTINRFISLLSDGMSLKSLFASNTKQFFRVTEVRPVEHEKCKAVVDALYSEGNDFISSADLQKLFSDIAVDSTETADSGSDDGNDSTGGGEELLTASLENALEKIYALPGNSAFKKEIAGIVKFAEAGKKPGHVRKACNFSCHYIFKSDAAVDHTMPARLMAEVFFHLGLVKKRKFAVLNIPEEGNEYSGINFESCIEVADTGVVFVEGIFDCEEENVDTKKVLNKLSEKMNQYKGRLLFILSFYSKDDKGAAYEALTSALDAAASCRQVDFPAYSRVETAELIESAAGQKGCVLSAEAVDLITDITTGTSENIFHPKNKRGYGIEHTVNHCIEKAFYGKIFTLLENNADLPAVPMLEPEDFRFVNMAGAPTVGEPDAASELAAMIGLEDVKNRVQQICNVLTVRARKKELGIDSKPVCLHMQFTGNPGTGKTTVARIMGKVLKNLGFLSSGHFVELTRNDLIGEYIGQTTPKVKKAVKKSKGGIMFIDEAYSLYQGAENDYGYEAVSELIKGMEDYKDDMVVIFAGYPKEMEKMVNMNPGLRDRIAFAISFPDYTPEDLLKIFLKMCADGGYIITGEATDALSGLVGKHFTAKIENFGNARIIRKLFERVEIIQSGRICGQNSFGRQEINVINPSDIQKLYDDIEIQAMLKSGSCGKTIGFRQ